MDSSLPPARPPRYAPPVTTREQAAAWLDAERANLVAATGYAATSGRLRHAMLIPAAISAILGSGGHLDQALALLQTALAAARQAADRAGQAPALNRLAMLHWRTGDRAAGVAAARQALDLYRDLGDQAGQISTLWPLGFLHAAAGDYPTATACHQQALELSRSTGDRVSQVRCACWPGPGATRHRGLPGGRGQPPAGAGGVPRSGRPGRPAHDPAVPG